MTATYPAFDGTQVCAQVDPELFFPERAGVAEEVWATDLCKGCEWRDQCLAYGLTHDVGGVWGGTSEQERKAIRRRAGITPVRLELSDTAIRLERMRAMRAAGLSTGEIAMRVGVTARSVTRSIGPMEPAERLMPPAQPREGCTTCARRRSALTISQRNLEGLARKVAAKPDDTWLRTLLEKAKANREKDRIVLDHHLGECEGAGAA